MLKTFLLVLAVVAGDAAPAAQHESGPVGLAKNLYAAARYDDALELLDALRDGSVEPRLVETYRSLCLLALGRTVEAEEAIAAVVVADPTYRPGDAEASPRIRSAFSEVRRRLLPELAAARYARGKTAYDAGDWAPAIDQFRVAVALLDDPDMSGRLPDLRLLATGFLELAIHAAAPPPAAAPPCADDGAHQSEAAPSGPAVSADRSEPFGADDVEVLPPVVVRQDLPKVPASLAGKAARGVLEVETDERGRVVGLSVRQSLHPDYDRLLLQAAQQWKYEPARLDGRAVRYRKLIQIAITR